MDKRILEMIANFQEWKGDIYRLASMIVELQKDMDREKLIVAGFIEAAEII